MAYDYSLLRVSVEDRVAFATVDNPPINLMTMALFGELSALSEQIAADDAVSVLVLKSANPDFFIAHFDVEAILSFPIDAPPARASELNAFHAMCECYRTMPKATIAQIEGRVGGGGSELAASFDMRFGVRGRTIVNQMEVPLGILPGGTGTQRLPRLVGRGRALEIILGGDDIDAETAECWGYLNRALHADEIEPFVTALAMRIASFSAPAIRAAKTAVLGADLGVHDGLIEEAYLFQQVLRTKEAQASLRAFLELGGQTREAELDVATLATRVAHRHTQSEDDRP